MACSFGEEISMEVKLRLSGPAGPKRVAMLVTKGSHCLEQLIPGSTPAAGRTAISSSCA